MPLYANHDGRPVRATLDGPRRGTCRDCDAPMIAKTGAVMIHHWAHEHRAENCSSGGETEWHIGWKARALDGTQEIAHPSGKRRADVLTPGGFAVEIQRYRMTAAETQAREDDWGGKLVWMFETSDAYAKQRMHLQNYVEKDNPFVSPTPAFWVHWFAPEMISAARCPAFYDLGNGYCIARGAGDLGYLVTVEQVVTCVLRGNTWPLPRVCCAYWDRRYLPSVPWHPWG